MPSPPLDPFARIWATALAAQRLGVGFLGIELDEQYLREAIARVAAAAQASASRPEANKKKRKG